MARRSHQDQIRDFYLALYSAWGRQHWWPADSRFEVVVGALLTQNTAWTNVERALAQLRAAGMLSLERLRSLPLTELEQLIRPSGYFRQKAQRLKAFVTFVDQRYRGSLEALFARPLDQLRPELLSLNGIGPETADSILLYAGNQEVFVVDAYTRRILTRHGILPEAATYDGIRGLVEGALSHEFAEAVAALDNQQHMQKKPAGAHHPPSPMSEEPRSPRAQIFNEMHGLIVGVGKNYCQKRRALCDLCPLSRFLSAPSRVELDVTSRTSLGVKGHKTPRK